MLERLLLTFQTSSDLGSIVWSMSWAAVLCLSLGLVYIGLMRNRVRAMREARIFPILGLTMALLGATISSSLAISLGMVGALSFIRYRVAISSKRYLIFLLLSISFGLSCGTNQCALAIISFFGITVAMVLSPILFGPRPPRIRLVIHRKTELRDGLVQQILDAFPQLRLQAFQTEGEIEIWEFYAQPKRSDEAKNLQIWLNALSNPVVFSLEMADDED